MDDIASDPSLSANPQRDVKGLRTIAPGLSKGLRLPGDELAEDLANMGTIEHPEQEENDEPVTIPCTMCYASELKLS